MASLIFQSEVVAVMVVVELVVVAISFNITEALMICYNYDPNC